MRGCGENEAILRTIDRFGGTGPLRDQTWIDRYADWHVGRFTEYGPVPLWIRPVDRAHGWVDDWRTTLRLRPPKGGRA